MLQQILQKTIETLLDLKAFNAHTQSQRADLAGSARQTKKSLLQILDPLRACVKIREISRDLEKPEQAYGGSATQRWQADKN